jgi:hypothetical protein
MAEKTYLEAGTSCVNISPPVGGELSGYGFYRNRTSTRIRSDLHARALVLGQGETRVAILATDLLAVSAEVTAQTRALVADTTGIPGDNVLIACSHTHSGPAVKFLRGCGEVDKEYVALLPRYLATAVSAAVANQKPVVVHAGQSTLDGLAQNRVDPNGEIDTEVQALEFKAPDSAIRSALFSFSCHPVTTLADDPEISDEFTGRACSLIERLPEYERALFLQGSCGDINPTVAHTNATEMQRASRMLAGAALVALAQAEKVKNVRPLRCLRRTITLPLKAPTREALERRCEDNRILLAEQPPDSAAARTARFWMEATEILLKQDAEELACELQAVRIGDIALVSHPTELFAEFGMEIKRQSPFAHTFVVGYTNDFLGYIPNAADFARHGYAADTVPYILGLNPYVPEIGHIFVDACVRLLTELREG